MKHIKKTYVIVYAFSIVHLLLGDQLLAKRRRENKPIPTKTSNIQETIQNKPIPTSYIQETIRGIDEYGVVVDTKLLKFNEPLATAYNASIIEQDGGYVLIFRQDTLKQACEQCKYTFQEIKTVYLDNNFDQMSPVKTLFLPAHYPEDARVHTLNKKLYITYNDEPGPHDHNKIRRIFLGKLDANIGLVQDIKELNSQNPKLLPVEKNWTPFEYPENSGSLYYIYTLSPYAIMKVDNINNGLATTITTVPTNDNTKDIDRIWLKKQWGGIRGGTPARLVDGVYLSFFHSWTYDQSNKNAYYFMGAYIFQAEPPFKMLAITPKPISFKGMYSAQHKFDYLHVTYPSGFAIERKGDKCLLHVSCGENDTSTRIISIDKDALFKSMVRIS